MISEEEKTEVNPDEQEKLKKINLIKMKYFLKGL